MKQQKGFSLVELVIVIIVVGLLAVAALPRFLDVTDEARRASIEGVAGGFATAVLSVRAQWEANARPVSSGQNTINYDGTDFWLTVEDNTNNIRPGYPVSVDSDQQTAIQDAAQCATLMEELLQNPPSVSSAVGSKYLVTADTLQNTCTYTQQENAGHFFEYDPETGRVTVTLN